MIQKKRWKTARIIVGVRQTFLFLRATGISLLERPDLRRPKYIFGVAKNNNREPGETSGAEIFMLNFPPAHPHTILSNRPNEK